MKVNPLVYPYSHPDGYMGHRDWFICPSCWQRFDFDRGGISSEYPPSHCPNADCRVEWDKPIYLEKVAKLPKEVVKMLQKKTKKTSERKV